MTLSFRNKPWWVHLCRWLWAALRWVWAVIILGVVTNLLSTWLSSKSQQFDLTGTPIGQLLEHPYLTISLGVGLMMITIIACLITVRNNESVQQLYSTIPEKLAEQNRDGFLRQLRYDYNNLLEQFLPNTMPPITLSWQSKPDAVRNTVPLQSQVPGQSRSASSASTSILQAYDNADGKLLILGDPGAGKTTLLLQLARDLRERAAQDPHLPLPVIVNLSTWANTRSSLQDWLVEEVASMYSVPRSLTAHWVEHNQLLPLLDGLDEVPKMWRSDCIEAINKYKQDHLGSLVVCCRTKKYSALPRQLRLRSAVVVQPLEVQQIHDYFQTQEIEEYFRKSGGSLFSVKKAYESLSELVKTPLLLRMLMLAYDKSDLSEQKNMYIKKKYLIEYYVNNRVEIYSNKYANGNQIESQIKQRYQVRQNKIKRQEELLRCQLTWLAQQMQQHNLKTFHIERMQPDWLPTTNAYERYAVHFPCILMGVLLSLLVNALTFGSFDPVRWIVCVFIGGQIGSLFIRAQTGKQAAGRQVKLLHSLGGSLLIGLSVWLGVWFTVGQAYTISEVFYNGFITGLSSAVSCFLLRQYLNPLKSAFKKMYMTIGQTIKTATGLSISAFRSWLYPVMQRFSLLRVVAMGIKHTLSVLFLRSHNGLNSSSSQSGSISTNEKPWEKIWQELTRAGHLDNGVLVGLIVGLVFGLGNGLVYGVAVGIQDGLTYCLTFGFVGILLSIIPLGLDKKIHPTEILTWSWRSLWRSLLSSKHWRQTLVVALSLGLAIGLTSGLSAFVGQWLDGHSFSFGVGVIIGLSTVPVDGLAYGLAFIMAYWSLLGLFRGLSSEYLPEDRHVNPNEGTWRSLRISVSVGISSGVVSGIIGFLSTMLYYGLYTVLEQGWNIGLEMGLRAGFSNVLGIGLHTGLVVGLQVGVFGALLAGAPMGGLAFLRHCILRWLLWRSHKIPFNYSRFLDRATDCILLNKVGGGYAFIHNRVLEHFASLED